jgi:hypothetical protein
MSSIYTSPIVGTNVMALPGVVHFDPTTYHPKPTDIPVQMKTTMVS